MLTLNMASLKQQYSRYDVIMSLKKTIIKDAHIKHEDKET